MKTFLMGVGAQKAGTTWLQHYLKNNTKIDFGFRKEYHVWDCITIPEYKFFRGYIDTTIYERIKKSDSINLSFIDNPDLYFEYFNNKLLNADITGDFTPQYSALSIQTYDYIIGKFSDLNIETKAIFLLRDPVDRLQSMMRMKLNHTNVVNPSYDTELLLMEEHCKSYNYYMTGGYNTIVPKLDKIFGSNIHYTFFDNLFTDNSTKQITDFLGVDHHQADYNFNPMFGKTDNELRPEAREYFETLYKPIYDYTADRFPQVKKLWTYYQK